MEVAQNLGWPGSGGMIVTFMGTSDLLSAKH